MLVGGLEGSPMSIQEKVYATSRSLIHGLRFFIRRGYYSMVVTGVWREGYEREENNGKA